MKRFFDASPPCLRPEAIVLAFTKRRPEELTLPERAFIVFDNLDLNLILARRAFKMIKSWLPFRKIYHIDNTNSIVARSYFGGPNIATTIEEFSSFGVKEFILWGYCGAIDKDLRIGDILIVQRALREDGVSYHYHEDDSEEAVYSNWYKDLIEQAKASNIFEAYVWTCDALYRETKAKVKRFREMGISAVEMEVASFYAVCNYRGVKGIAFLIVSDILMDNGWKQGFGTDALRQGRKRLFSFLSDNLIR